VFGWRGAFFCLVPIALAAFTLQWFSLPAMAASTGVPRSGNVFAPLNQRRVRLGMLAVGFFFMGQFALFTYVRPFLETVTRVDAATLSLMLLAMGMAAFVGAVLVGRVLRAGFYRTLLVIPLVMAARHWRSFLSGPLRSPRPCCWPSGGSSPRRHLWAGGPGSRARCRWTPKQAAA